MDEADSKRGGRVEALAGDEVAAGGTFADLAKRIGRDHGRDDSELDLGECKDRPLVCDRDIGDGNEAGTAAEGVALDKHHDRSGAGIDRLEHPAQGVGVGDVFFLREVDRRTHPLDVRAGAEGRSLAADHHRTCLADVDKRFCELRDKSCVERVAGSRAARA